MRKPQIVYCPKCKNRVARFYGKASVNIVARCSKCKKRIIYHVDTGETEMKELPPRTTSSGIEFC